MRIRVEFDDNGMTATGLAKDGSVKKTQVEWSQVNGVVAFKRDLLTVDLICIGLSTPESSIEVDEEMEGWKELIEALPRLLPGTLNPSEWWDKVAHPAFATNPTVLFSR